MIKDIKLIPQEKAILRKTCRLQLESIERILDNETSIDLPMFFIKEEASREDTIKVLETRHALYVDLYNYPHEVFNLTGNEQEIFYTCLGYIGIDFGHPMRIHLSNIYRKINFVNHFRLLQNPN